MYGNGMHICIFALCCVDEAELADKDTLLTLITAKKYEEILELSSEASDVAVLVTYDIINGSVRRRTEHVNKFLWLVDRRDTNR